MEPELITILLQASSMSIGYLYSRKSWTSSERALDRMGDMAEKFRSMLWFCLLISLLSLAPVVHAQTTASDPEAILSSDLIGHALPLRNMSADTKIQATWDGNELGWGLPRWHTFAALNVSKVKVKNAEVTIEGDRMQIVRNEDGSLGLGKQKTHVVLTVNLIGDPATLAPSLRNALFFPNFVAAIPAVPAIFQKAVLRGELTKKDPSDAEQVSCDCADTSVPCRNAKKTGIVHPKVLSSVDPDFSDEARAFKKFSGSVQVGIRIDKTGAIADEWLIRDLGYGLDEQAAVAVRHYKFAPATFHNVPIETSLFVDVNFEKF
jgi:hypothetical protein